MGLKELMGSAYKEGMTEAEINAFLDNGKYVNLNEGKYVDKEKLTRIETEKAKAEKDLNDYKEANKDVDSIRKENETLKAEKASRELDDKLLGYGFNKDSLKYVKGDINDKTLVIGEKDEDNKKAVEEYLKTHPQFGVKQATGRRVVVSTGVDGKDNKGGNSEVTYNASINDSIRAKAGKKVNI